ncbi:MAG TPA: hypothetical protein VFW62_09325 [bacterium]|nr:hypothetical protein [bacterium]
MIRSGLVLSLFLLATAPASAQRGEAYAPKDGRFTVRFPGKPKETTQTAKSTIGELAVATATYATTDGNVYMVSYTDFPTRAAKPENSGSLFDGVRNGLKGKDGKLLDEKEIKVGPDKLPGRDIEIEKDKKRMKFRVALHNGRLYQVAVIGTAAFVKNKDATAFLESFEITP